MQPASPGLHLYEALEGPSRRRTISNRSWALQSSGTPPNPPAAPAALRAPVSRSTVGLV